MLKKKRALRIGIFDSGFGGLHVLRSVVRTLPKYDYVYLGDTARAPYGDRSQRTIYAYTKQAVDFLFSRGCGIVIIACNTASSEALRKIQDEYGARKKVLGVLIPAAEEAVRRTKNRRVGVIATRSTVASSKFVRELAKLDPNTRVFQKACPLLVPLIEAGEHNSCETETILKKYLAPLLEKKIDTLILGCTHYGILKRKIRKIIGPDIAIVSEEGVVPEKLKRYLARHPEIEETLGTRLRTRFYTTDRTDRFEHLGSKFFGKKIRVEKAVLR
ncbi:glutamate racemase [Candidatus Kaiserbacteria bacterium]|nr:glutamate racemase [Candidatus Kaiserbacteria bacterium]